MRSSRCISSTATALHRVFIGPIEHSAPRVPFQRGQYIPNIYSKLSGLDSQRRNYASAPPAKRRLPYDDQITAYAVHLVDDEGRLSAPQQTAALLQSLDRSTQTLITVANPSRAGEDGPSIPVCKIMSKKALREADKARSKKKDNPTATVKTIELNWAIDGNDLRHRLDRMKQFLSKGWRVDVVMAGKRKGRKATIDEAEEVLRVVRQRIAEVDGAKEWKRMEGAVGKQALLFAEGKAQKDLQEQA
ncbi:MAG: hypothetical protein M1818_003431 [Claussenomyces sp. TS43310]|nr:MAG: hypothetical protein M1818_003431 [Claussenomyces sp. TS43310]